MLTIIRAIWKPLSAGGLILLALWTFSHIRYQAGYDAADSAWKLKDEKRQTADALALASAQARQRDEEKRRRDETTKATDVANAQLAKARADADGALRAGEQLRTTLSAIRRQLAASETSKLSAAAAGGAAGADTGILLTDVLGSADKRAGELAEYADRVSVRAQTCESIYKGVTGTH
ncbi:DUF2514 family protein [Enterobacter sp. Cy-643]|uniref:DUF2514 family protein n=1 Tax=Enterobacter sp. Cy-643 TaxID=2608346 RepID=UPI00141F6930|nr:DUF2514 family protein [Enterobacter sp. Cy-643]NIF31678.1 DUF2514 family protein [Enterobacter sp. Cy-643]